jgi:hypothetical protein
MTDEELADARARCDAATRGPWSATYHKDDRFGRCEVTFEAAADATKKSAEADAQFLAHARTDLPAALDEIEALRQHNDFLKELLADVNEAGGNPVTAYERGKAEERAALLEEAESRRGRKPKRLHTSMLAELHGWLVSRGPLKHEPRPSRLAAENARLAEENATLRAQTSRLAAENARLAEENATLRAQIEELLYTGGGRADLLSPPYTGEMSKGPTQ